jgi:DNA repair protein RadC
LTEVFSPERLRERLSALGGAQLSEAEVIKLLTDLINFGGGVSLELDELRVKLIRREGHFALKDARAHSSLPPRTVRPPR